MINPVRNDGALTPPPERTGLSNGVNWEYIDSVLLDMDGTLLDKYFDDYFWEHFLPVQYAVKYHLYPDDARAELLKRYKSQEGKLTWTDLDYWTEELGMDIPALKAQIEHIIDVHPYVVDFLRFLKRKGKRTYLVTNAHYKTLDIKMKKTRIGEYFDKTLTSFDVGMPKETPDGRFWRKAERILGFDRERTLLVDDSESVLRSAKEYGIKYLLYKARPSSRGPTKLSKEFSSIVSFKEIM